MRKGYKKYIIKVYNCYGVVENMEIEGKPLTIEGVSLFLHPATYRNKDFSIRISSSRWRVSDTSTGFAIPFDPMPTQKLAIQKAKWSFSHYGKERIMKDIERVKAEGEG